MPLCINVSKIQSATPSEQLKTTAIPLEIPMAFTRLQGNSHLRKLPPPKALRDPPQVPSLSLTQFSAIFLLSCRGC